MRMTVEARYLPITISQSLTGEVSNNSKVPNFSSSENKRIVIRGENIINNKVVGSRYPLTFDSVIGLDSLGTILVLKNSHVNPKNIAPTI